MEMRRLKISRRIKPRPLTYEQMIHQQLGQQPRIRPRLVHDYQINPRSSIPPNWQVAQRLVKALVVSQIGDRPRLPWNHPIGTVYSRLYRNLRTQYEREDFPINP